MISIVMMSYLGEYPGSRSNPIQKFNRAVQSVLEQTYQDWELLIVSDGCELTNQEYLKNWAQDPRIQLIKTEKSKSKWPGTKRQIGVNAAKGQWICYLDSDDLFLPNRLSSAVQCISKSTADVIFDSAKAVVFDNTKLKPHKTHKQLKLTQYNVAINLDKSVHMLEFGDTIYCFTSNVGNKATGTWCVFHKKGLNTQWLDSEKSGEDTDFIKRLKKNHKCEYLFIEGYIIRHSAVRGWDI